MAAGKTGHPGVTAVLLASAVKYFFELRKPSAAGGLGDREVYSAVLSRVPETG